MTLKVQLIPLYVLLFALPARCQTVPGTPLQAKQAATEARIDSMLAAIFIAGLARCSYNSIRHYVSGSTRIHNRGR